MYSRTICNFRTISYINGSGEFFVYWGNVANFHTRPTFLQNWERRTGVSYEAEMSWIWSGAMQSTSANLSYIGQSCRLQPELLWIILINQTILFHACTPALQWYCDWLNDWSAKFVCSCNTRPVTGVILSRTTHTPQLQNHRTQWHVFLLLLHELKSHYRGFISMVTRWIGTWVCPRAGLEAVGKIKMFFPCHNTNLGRPARILVTVQTAYFKRD
jgi:hypothetical protein